MVFFVFGGGCSGGEELKIVGRGRGVSGRCNVRWRSGNQDGGFGLGGGDGNDLDLPGLSSGLWYFEGGVGLSSSGCRYCRKLDGGWCGGGDGVSLLFFRSVADLCSRGVLTTALSCRSCWTAPDGKENGWKLEYGRKGGKVWRGLPKRARS